jgi:hypothetical protein
VLGVCVEDPVPVELGVPVWLLVREALGDWVCDAESVWLAVSVTDADCVTLPERACDALCVTEGVDVAESV